MKIADDLRRIGTQQAGALVTENGEVWHPANLLIPAADSLDALSQLAQWMTGCGYDFTKHPYFLENQHLLSGSGNTDPTPEASKCLECGMVDSFDGMWHRVNCSKNGWPYG